MEFDLEIEKNFYTDKPEYYLSLKLDLTPLNLPAGSPTSVKGYLPLEDLAEALKPFLNKE